MVGMWKKSRISSVRLTIGTIQSDTQQNPDNTLNYASANILTYDSIDRSKNAALDIFSINTHQNHRFNMRCCGKMRDFQTECTVWRLCPLLKKRKPLVLVAGKDTFLIIFTCITEFNTVTCVV